MNWFLYDKDLHHERVTLLENRRFSGDFIGIKFKLLASPLRPIFLSLGVAIRRSSLK